MRGLQVIAALVLCLLLVRGWGVPAYAAQVTEEQWQALQPERLEAAAQAAGEEQSLTLDISLGEGVQALAQKGLEQAEDILRSTLRTGVLLMLAALLCGILGAAQQPLGRGGAQLTALVGTAAILTLSMGDVSSLATMGRETMEEMEQFSKVLLPTMTGAAVAGGEVTGAALRQSATLLFSDVLLTLMNRLLMPMVYLYIALCAGYAAVGNPGIKKLAGLVKWGVTTLLTLVVTAYVTWLTASSAIAGTADALTAKTARLAISTMIPVVGNILASATETVVAGAGLVKNAVGIFGLLVILGICLLPVLEMGVHYLVYQLASALSATLSGGGMSGLIGEIGTAFGLILGMTGAGAVVLLVSLVAGLLVTTG